jgi:predicted lipoprotein
MRGLATLDYLLFYEGNQNACDDSVTINADGSWSALSTDERSRRRAAYAAVVARDVAKAAKGMADGWSEGFADALASGAAPFSSPDDAVGALSDGLFYLDKALKDRKLGQPLGLVNCEDKSCPESVQGAHSRRGVALARANLEGARRLLLGCGEGTLGFTSLLGSLGADDVAEKVVAQLDDAAAAAEALGSDDLAALLESNRAGVVELYDRVRWLGDTLETEWTTVLGVTIPSTVQGDND